MRKQIIFIFVITGLLLCACDSNLDVIEGSGNIIQEERPVQGIQGVTLATLGDLTIELGEQESLTIEAEENLLPYLETEVRGGILTIRSQPNTNLRPTEPVRYYLTVTSLDTLEVASSGNIEAPALQADDFTIKISSSGRVHLTGLEADSIRVESNSSGDVVIDAGQIGQQDITINSSGDYKAEDVQSQRATIDIQSNGDATVWVTDRLDADLSSSGNVNYYGSPEITQSVTSSGKVISLGGK